MLTLRRTSVSHGVPSSPLPAAPAWTSVSIITPTRPSCLMLPVGVEAVADVIPDRVERSTTTASVRPDNEGHQLISR